MSARPPDPRDEVQALAQNAIARLSADLKAGRSQTLKDYLAAMGRFHKYSWTNAVLIQSQRPTATRVAGYHTWHELGRFVRRGEKGIRIYAPLVMRGSPDRLPSAPSERSRQDHLADEMRLKGFRVAYVFDVEQTDGKPLPEFAKTKGDPKEFTDRLKAFVAERGIALEYDSSIGPAAGESHGGRIRLQPGLSPAEEFSTLAHELAHEMLHHGTDRAEFTKVARETQAEAVAFVVSRGIGLEGGSAAADYIALYNGDDKTLAQSLATIQETSSTILRGILPREPERAERVAPLNSPVDAGAREQEVDTSSRRPVPSEPDHSDGLAMER